MDEGKAPSRVTSPSNDFRTATNSEDHAMDATTSQGDQPPMTMSAVTKKSVRCNIFCNQS
jgi:hypothetical protein